MGTATRETAQPSLQSAQSVTDAPPVEGVTSGRSQSDRVVEQVTTVEEVTASQIERTGASTLDEALRLMPGVSFLNGGDACLA